ncbi:hypothetical protein O6H91_05G032300 [Diphasiastrum complanatum]|uniref:Uncharacterized protein n=2 Tax=Diphasiastrum complanatum TaxID=34168 RepID=A0ACC2DMD9_DIPCM|nr:hypothetical protein O6H91_05G032300 [Diphasiastrum complanatum]KAJ7555326.1 hypothetical protein O6H91_05G032300 [Diphasiastrum complanatum]
MIGPLPGLWPLKPGSATLPCFGVEPVVLDPQSREQDGACEGYLCIKKPWPGIARTIYEDHRRYEDTYFSAWLGYYNSGDGCRRDADGYIWITGRVDDVINVSGHRISTAEVESALASNPCCAEAAVVAIDHEVKGQGMCAFITLLHNYKPSADVKKSLEQSARTEIGAFAVPDLIYFVPGLPKTRSGKIMRHILRKIASKQMDNLGDISTLADPSVVRQIIELRMKK